MMDDEVRCGYAPFSKLRDEFRYGSCALWLTNKIAPVMMREQLAEGGNVVKLAAI